MKKLKINLNIIFISLGSIILLIELTYMINGLLGWLLTSIGVILVGIGIFYKSNNPIKLLIKLLMELL